AMKYNPLHPSSNYYTGAMLKSSNKIPSLLAYLTFVICEPESDRSKLAFEAVKKLMSANVKKDGNNTTIYISKDMMDKKNSKKENDFSNLEFIFSLAGALDDSKEMDSIASTPAAKFDFKLQLLING